MYTKEVLTVSKPISLWKIRIHIGRSLDMELCKLPNSGPFLMAGSLVGW
jgi:hypothetical protein